MRLAGKVAIITGAGSGMGRATALLFAREGAKVVAAGRRAGNVQQTVEEIRKAGGEAIAIRADVSKEEDVANMVKAALANYGGLDILFNNAGIFSPTGLEDVSTEQWDECMDINAKSVFLGCKYAIPEMRKRGGGSIISTSSAAGLVGSSKSPIYSAAKFAVVGLTKSLAIALGKDNIRVNAVCPGPTDTAMTPVVYGSESDEAREKRVAALPMGRSGKPEEVAQAVLFLASDAASYITGIAMPVDGGHTAK